MKWDSDEHKQLIKILSKFFIETTDLGPLHFMQYGHFDYLD